MNKTEIDVLINNIQKGDFTSAELLYQEIMPTLLKVSYSVLKDKFLAEDVAQDTFIQFYNSLQSYTVTHNAVAYICTIAYNRSINVLNKTKREFIVADMENQDEENMDLSIEDKIIRTISLRDYLSCLSEEEQRIVIWHVCEGLKHREIAQIMQIPVNTVFSKYRRSIHKLRKQLTLIKREGLMNE